MSLAIIMVPLVWAVTLTKWLNDEFWGNLDMAGFVFIGGFLAELIYFSLIYEFSGVAGDASTLVTSMEATMDRVLSQRMVGIFGAGIGYAAFCLFRHHYPRPY